MASASIRVGRLPNGFCIRLEGRCTMRESPAAHAFAAHALDDPAGGVLYVDVRDCAYLDSTFLGALVDLHRRFAMREPRVVLLASLEARQKLFAPLHLDRVLRFAEQAPAPVEAWMDLGVDPLRSKDETARHVCDCHKRLAELGGPNRAAFATIAAQMERELGEGSR